MAGYFEKGSLINFDGSKAFLNCFYFGTELHFIECCIHSSTILNFLVSPWIKPSFILKNTYFHLNWSMVGRLLLQELSECLGLSKRFYFGMLNPIVSKPESFLHPLNQNFHHSSSKMVEWLLWKELSQYLVWYKRFLLRHSLYFRMFKLIVPKPGPFIQPLNRNFHHWSSKNTFFHINY